MVGLKFAFLLIIFSMMNKSTTKIMFFTFISVVLLSLTYIIIRNKWSYPAVRYGICAALLGSAVGIIENWLYNQLQLSIIPLCILGILIGEATYLINVKQNRENENCIE